METVKFVSENEVDTNVKKRGNSSMIILNPTLRKITGLKEYDSIKIFPFKNGFTVIKNE